MCRQERPILYRRFARLQLPRITPSEALDFAHLFPRGWGPGVLGVIAVHNLWVRDNGTGIHARPFELLRDVAHGLGIDPDAVRGAVVRKIAVGSGESDAGGGLSPSGKGGQQSDGHRLAGAGRHLSKLAAHQHAMGPTFGA